MSCNGDNRAGILVLNAVPPASSRVHFADSISKEISAYIPLSDDRCSVTSPVHSFCAIYNIIYIPSKKCNTNAAVNPKI